MIKSLPQLRGPVAKTADTEPRILSLNGRRPGLLRAVRAEADEREVLLHCRFAEESEVKVPVRNREGVG